MPGIFESLKRMAQGKPVFDANDSSNNSGWTDASGNTREAAPDPAAAQQQGQTQPEAPKTGVVKGQPSTFPVVIVKRTRAQVNGNNQSVYCSIVNRSNESVEVDEIELEGSSRRLGGFLRPGEEREWLCYSGPCSSSEGHKVAKLNYKVHETGDYFQSIYDVEYELGTNKLYSIEELHWRQPIMDIYG